MEPLPNTSIISNKHQSHSNLLSINPQFNFNNNSSTTSLTHTNSAIALNQLVNYETRLNLNHLNHAPSIVVNLNCNRCGKNLLNTSTALNNLQHFLQLNQKLPNVNTSGHGMKLNESVINGCQSCKNFLPQCTICLKLMKINLSPNPSLSQAQTSGSQISMNRSQSLYVPSSKMILSISNYPKTNIQFQLKSPNNMVINKAIGNFQSFDNNNYANYTETFSSDSNNGHVSFGGLESGIQIQPRQVNDENLAEKTKYTMQIENMSFLSNSRYGDWFSWCQTCKHGGHLKHMLEWFRVHDKCSFLHCKCQCLKIDRV